ncbi:hypothetical protein CWI38_1872p0010 [Hamiltosporidium tvaerminnensis]|uniref:Uncharacterized protein n=2 Tax=Hamiltosporidium TaxID=1176354 RepID=A0A4V2JX35_9MICR|nr:hypothetical protein CWI37_0451p0010 [Hamiltosporidium tvaerminnensis]TBU06949.1 hypothetical protein CWI36_0353p0010 [Hamiltosporidium magnivora]TBU10292.1 hypothetical protein CWI38_1872p0010 [Hamiltosporidium tvaerminnensis]
MKNTEEDFINGSQLNVTEEMKLLEFTVDDCYFSSDESTSTSKYAIDCNESYSWTL